MHNEWIYDYETLKNCFIAVFKNRQTKVKHIFVVHKFLKNDWYKLTKFLKEARENKDVFLGFNNLAFDSQVSEFILVNADYLTGSKDQAERIYNFVQEHVINADFAPIPPDVLSTKQVDIFKLNHWDNPNKSCSLKWAQFNMDWHNIEEMPYPHDYEVKDFKTLHEIINYCINDVESTEAIFNYRDKKGKAVMQENIDLRKELTEKYNIDLTSASEPKIASEVFLDYLSKDLKVNKKALKKSGGTKRSKIKVKDLLLPYIRFNTTEFNRIYWGYKDMTVDIDFLKSGVRNASKRYQQSTYHKDVESVFGLGGAHACIKSGIYTSNEKYVIKSVDVTSFYPFLSIRNKFSPAHLPKEKFCELYENLFFERAKYKKGTALNYLFKIILNSTYGLSMNEHSFLYDPFLTFSITINGQLLLTMLYEELSLMIPGSQPLMQNTDGLEILIPREYESRFDSICAEWQKETGLQLEFFEYQKMIIGDVNNYIGIFTDGSIKRKGRFEYDDLPLHKNKSSLVIPKAIYEYFINGVAPEDYIKSNKNVFDYCYGVKLRGDAKFKEVYVESGVVKEKLHKKVLRYIVTEHGSKILRETEKESKQLIGGKYLQTICNNINILPEFDKIGVDYNYYLSKIYSEIHSLESGNFNPDEKAISNVQLKLF